MTEAQKKLSTLFEELAIKTTWYTHEPLYTVEQAQAVAHVVPGAWCKNLFLKDDKRRMWLIVALASTSIALKKVAQSLSAVGLRFAQPDLLQHYLGVLPGSVTPFGLINDSNHEVTVLLDKELFIHEKVSFHPLRNDASVVIAPADLERFIQSCGNNCMKIDFKALE